LVDIGDRGDHSTPFEEVGIESAVRVRTGVKSRNDPQEIPWDRILLSYYVSSTEKKREIEGAMPGGNKRGAD